MDSDAKDLPTNESQDENFFGLYYHNFYVIAVASIIGITADVIIIASITFNKRMQNRTNLILLIYATLDIMNQVMSPIYFTSIYEHNAFKPKSVACIIYNLDIISQHFETVSMILIRTDFIILGTRFTDKTIICSIISVMIVVNVIPTICCLLKECIANSFFLFSYPTISLVLLAIPVYVDIYRTYKNAIIPLSRETKFRTDITRIYIYLSVTVALLIGPIHWGPIGIVIFSVQNLISVFLVVYMYRADQRFRICVLNLFRKKENRYNIDATIGFNEDFEEDDDQKVIIEVTPTEDTNHYEIATF